MLQFLYSGSYCAPEAADEEGNENISRFDFHIAIYAIADKYDITALANLAILNYKATISESWDLTLFLRSISYIYTVTSGPDSRLRRYAADTAKQKMSEITR